MESGNKMIIPSRNWEKSKFPGGESNIPQVSNQNNLLKSLDYNSESLGYSPLPYNQNNLVESRGYSDAIYNDEYINIIKKTQDLQYKSSNSSEYSVKNKSRMGSISSSIISQFSDPTSQNSIPRIIKNIKEFFESKRLKALEKEKIKIDSIKLKTYEKIKELIEFENNLVSQINLITLNEIPKSIPQIPTIKSDKIQENPIKNTKPAVENVFDGYLINSSYISTDLINVKNFAFPPTFIKGSNLTFFNKNEILVADSKCSVFSLNVHTGVRKDFGKFKVKRTYFSLCVIKNKPTVIAGIDSSNKSVCNTVEYLQGNNNWIKGSSLNQIRSHCSSISHKGCAYVMGGFSGGYLDSIEKFEHTWQLLDVKLPFPMSKFPLCGKGTEIYVFGGKTFSGENRSVYIFDTIKAEFRKSNRNLGKSLEETNNGGVIFRNDQFYILDSNKVIKYKE